MDQICRLCLTMSENMSCKLSEETEILDTLSSINIQIQINKMLPSLVCRTCIKILNDFTSYRESVVQNQCKLTEQLNKNTHNNYYQSLEHGVIVKIEANIDTEFNFTDPNPYSSSDDIKINKKDKSAIKINDDYCKLIEKSDTVTIKEEKRPSKLKKENCTQKNISKCINQIKKRKSKSKEEMKRKKFKAKEDSIGIKNATEVCEEEAQNIPEEKNKFECRTDENESSIEKSTLRTSEIGVINDNKCLTCFKSLPTTSALIKHYRTVHLNTGKKNALEKSEEIAASIKADRPFYCKICGRTFASVYAIVRHARAHSNYILSCSHGCGFSTAYQWALRTHEKLHEKDFKFKCATCNVGFNVKTWHDQHQNIHKNIKPFVCNLCGVAFHMDRYLKSHRSAVHPDFIKGIKRLCPHCGQAFDNARLYRIHLEEHLGKKKKKYLCDLCGKECSSREQLKYHNNSHLGLKPFACSLCNKSFTKKYNLTVHQKAHTGEKHLCQDCGKYFAQKSTLMRHARRCHPESKDCKNDSESAKEIK